MKKMRTVRTILRYAAAALLVIVLPAFSALAKTDDEKKDYTIDVFWNEKDSLGKGDLFCEWTRSESATKYMIDVYRFEKESQTNYEVVKAGEDTENRVRHFGSYSGTSINIGRTIIENGSGYYIFSVVPQKGGKEYKEVSGWLCIDNRYLSNLTRYYKDTYGFVPGFARGSGGNQSSGISSGGPGVTNESDSGQGTDTGLRAIDQVSITIGQKEPERGKVWTATIVKPLRTKLLSVEYSEPYEKWVAGKNVKITAVFEPEKGWRFDSKTRFDCDNGSITERTVSENNARITVSYTPRLKLKTPGNIFIDSSGVLKFDAVPYAEKYVMRVKVLETVRADTSFSKNSKDVSFYLEELKDPTFFVKATSTRNYIFDSDPVQFHAGDLVPEEERENGFTGWSRESGKWYHYTEGLADGPGWWQDVDSHWYYFGDDKAMVKGPVTVDGAEYFFNDGSVGGIPEGACLNR